MLTAVRDTSVEAFHAHRGISVQQRGRILAFVKARGGSWSIGEIAHALNMQKSTVSARVHELVHETGELVEREKRKDRISGITIRPVGLPPGQCDLFGGMDSCCA